MSEDSDSREPDGSMSRSLRGTSASSPEPLRQAAGWILIYTVLVVILFGAFVRASLSGDGCGEHWPHCYGSLLPLGHPAKTWIEFTHRATSGVLILATAALWFFSRRSLPAGDVQRRAAGFSFLFVLISGAIGAVLVLNKWVVFDRSAARAITMPLHLVNNYLLVAALIVTVLPPAIAARIRPKRQGEVGGLLWASAWGMFLLGATGALSAMGKTAFQRELEAAQGLAARMSMHFGDSAHPLLRGGVIHPLIATSVLILILAACSAAMKKRPCPEVDAWAKRTIGITLFQMAFGLLNLWMSAPVWMQLGHLLLALLAWGSLIMVGVHAFQRTQTQEDFLEASMESGDQARPPAGIMAIVGQYVVLTKPRVISLLLFTTVLAMVIAKGGWPPVWQMLLVAIGGYMMAGAANTFNMVVEKDLDVAMERTAKRPTVSGSLTTGQVLVFAFSMAAGSFALLTLSSNLLAASLALAGLLFYVFVYTLLLKRRTWQNIVIGGAAGAFPPLVGYAAVTGDLSPFAWALFALIFFWTPVHFWALAILIKDDYAKAGVPMLPVVKGDRTTVIHIVVYAVLTALISIIPLFQKEVGMLYVAGSVLLNLGLLVQSLQLLRDTTTVRAKALFKYSMIYLALMFVVAAADRILGMTA
jgi:heme o synthase